MSLPSGFVLKDSHLIRGVAALVVISVLVPGIFGVGPPQYFGDDDTRLAALQQPDEAPPTPTPDMPAPGMPAAEIKICADRWCRQAGRTGRPGPRAAS